MGFDGRKPVFRGVANNKDAHDQSTHADWSWAPLLFTYWKVSYLNLLQAKFQYSS